MKKDDIIKGVIPQFFPKHWLDEPGIVFADFPSRIRIGYVHRVDGGYSYLMEHEFPELAMSVARATVRARGRSAGGFLAG